MTFKQAFTSWSLIPKNISICANCREPVNRVLMKKYCDVELEQFSKEFVSTIFKDSAEVQELKTRAASVLVCVLHWGAENGYCNHPSFDYTIAGASQNPPDKEARPAAKSRGKAPQPVAQLRASSREIIRVWPSRAQAERELGIKNIDRAVSRRCLAGGFFWCNSKDVESFEPAARGHQAGTR